MERNGLKRGFDRKSSMPPITVSGLISSNQRAQLNISEADSLLSSSSFRKNKSPFVGASTSLLLRFTLLAPTHSITSIPHQAMSLFPSSLFVPRRELLLPTLHVFIESGALRERCE